MNASTNPTSSTARWQDQVKPFRESSVAASTWQTVTTVLGLVVMWALMVKSLEVGWWLTWLLAFPAGGFTVRCFIINHDCGHAAFFKSRRANDIVGFWTGMLCFTPYKQWRHGHALHHASSGQIEERGVGYLWIMTADEYRSATGRQRAWYRFYRNPFILFTIGGLYAFLLEYRFSFRSTTADARRGVWGHNVALAAILGGLSFWLGWETVLLVQAPICIVALPLGLALFYVQHHFDDSYWAPKGEWSYERAAFEGSSYIELPRVLEYFVGSINYHHIHHLAPKVPNYRLREAHYAVDMFRAVKPITWKQIRESWRLRIVDEKTNMWTDYPSLEEEQPETKLSGDTPIVVSSSH
jgi:omega-6 fatty acid desaturase (delta-12 desaturase)